MGGYSVKCRYCVDIHLGEGDLQQLGVSISERHAQQVGVRLGHGGAGRGHVVRDTLAGDTAVRPRRGTLAGTRGHEERVLPQQRGLGLGDGHQTRGHLIGSLPPTAAWGKRGGVKLFFYVYLNIFHQPTWSCHDGGGHAHPHQSRQLKHRILGCTISIEYVDM